MKINLIVISLAFIGSSVYAEENLCEKTWDNDKSRYSNLNVYSKVVSCKQIWEDKNKEKLVKKMGLNPKDPQWMSTGECQILEVNKVKYQIYYAYFKNDLSDLRIINDTNGNYFGYFRDLGRYDMSNDKFYPTKRANKMGVELKCSEIGINENLKFILNSYIKNKKIDNKKFTFEDIEK